MQKNSYIVESKLLDLTMNTLRIPAGVILSVAWIDMQREFGRNYHGVDSRNLWGTHYFIDGEYKTQKCFNFVQMQQLNTKQTALTGEKGKWREKNAQTWFIHSTDLYPWHLYSHKFYKSFYNVLAMFYLGVVLKLWEETERAQLQWNSQRKM